MDFLYFLLIFSAGAFAIGFIFGAILKGSALGALLICGILFLVLMALHIPWESGVVETLAIWRHEHPENAIVWLSVYAFYSGAFTCFSFLGYFLGGKARNACQRRCRPAAEQGDAENGGKPLGDERTP